MEGLSNSRLSETFFYKCTVSQREQRSRPQWENVQINRLRKILSADSTSVLRLRFYYGVCVLVHVQVRQELIYVFQASDNRTQHSLAAARDDLEVNSSKSPAKCICSAAICWTRFRWTNLDPNFISAQCCTVLTEREQLHLFMKVWKCFFTFCGLKLFSFFFYVQQWTPDTTLFPVFIFTSCKDSFIQ